MGAESAPISFLQVSEMSTFESEELEEREDRFISGVYNYCDRWCEKCRFSDRCRVYDSERAMMERHEILGEDPADPEIMLQDVSTTFEHTIDLLRKMADEMGVDLDSAPPPSRSRKKRDNSSKHPLLRRTDHWMDRIEPLLDTVRQEVPQLGEELANSLFREDDEQKVEERGQEILESVGAVRDAYELLCRYRYFIVIKLTRALRALSEADSEMRRDTEMAEYSLDDARGTAKLLDESIGKIVRALWAIAEFHRPWFDTAVPLAAAGESIRQQLAETFPDFHKFHRPGFDDEPED